MKLVFGIITGILILFAGSLLAWRSKYKTSQDKRTNVVSEGGTFSVMQGEVDGRPLVAMIDMGLRDLPDKQALPFFLSLSTSLMNPTNEGLPIQSDADNLNRWEEVVESQLRPVTKLAFVGRVTWNGHRELLYYVASQQPTIEALKALSGPRPFSFKCDRDKKWVNANYWLNR
jgi:hypothetical protein